MQTIRDLERLGYQFSLQDGRIRYSRVNDAAPPAGGDFVKKLLKKVVEHPEEAVAFLRQREQGHSEGLSTQAHTPGPDDAAAMWAAVFGGQPDPGGVKARQALEAELSELIDRWQADLNPQHHAGYARRYAELAIQVGLPCYADDLSSDLGAEGWRRWAETF